MGHLDMSMLRELQNAHKIDEKLIASCLAKYKILDDIGDHGHTIYFLFNYNTLSFEYISKNAFAVTGADPKYCKDNTEVPLLKIFREHDLPVLNEIEKSFRMVRDQYDQEDIQNLCFQIFTRFSKGIFQNSSGLIQYQLIKTDDEKKPLLSFGWITKVGIGIGKDYAAIAVHHLGNARSEIVFDKKVIYQDIELSNREIEIIKHLMIGKTSKKIGEDLNISAKTVNNHRQNILKKLGAKSTYEVIKYAIQHGLFE